MMPSRLAAAALAASLLMPPALAGEHTGYHYLEVRSGALQPCRTGILLSLPASWQVGDGAVVLVTAEQTHDLARDVLVATLLFEEHAAVVELAPMRCDAALGAQHGVAAAAIDALNALTRTMGRGMVVAIGYGPGGGQILDVVRPPAAALLGADGPRYAAAVALGDGAPAFALGAPSPVQEAAPQRLAILCHALAVVVGSMAATAERAAPAAASEACMAAMAGALTPAATSVPTATRY
ncbi:hypothetical protein [Falsiroseomonas sp. E2-1-a4]|uniref:hypothetical protein n=1 Tax=Falsiroseomonas sp. E2-1-a4 TaxID=3239299 RepID=UPI003F387B31